MRAAFDKVNRKEIWEMMRNLGIGRKLRKRVEEIYEESNSTLRVGEKQIGGFDNFKGVRQGCPLSPALFNVAMVDTQKEMSKGQEGGVILGKKKFWSLSYADDVVLLATNRVGLNQMLRRCKRMLKRKGLEWNTEKSKIMVFKKEEEEKRKTNSCGTRRK